MGGRVIAGTSHRRPETRSAAKWRGRLETLTATQICSRILHAGTGAVDEAGEVSRRLSPLFEIPTSYRLKLIIRLDPTRLHSLRAIVVHLAAAGEPSPIHFQKIRS